MLSDLQKKFLKSFYRKEKRGFLEYVRSNDNMSALERFEIYADSITEGLIRALRETFPVIEKLVGEDFFREMAHQFILQTPALSPNLNDYGNLFADFVATFPPAQTLLYLTDVGHLEWCWQQVYYGPDYIPMNFDALRQVAPEQHPFLILKRPPNSFLLKSCYPIKAIWRTNQNDYAGDDEIYLVEGYEERLLVWRPSMEVLIELLTEVQWMILTSFDEGMTLAQVAENLSSHEQVDLSVEIPHMVSQGWFTGYDLRKV